MHCGCLSLEVDAATQVFSGLATDDASPPTVPPTPTYHPFIPHALALVGCVLVIGVVVRSRSWRSEVVISVAPRAGSGQVDQPKKATKKKSKKQKMKDVSLPIPPTTQPNDQHIIDKIVTSELLANDLRALTALRFWVLGAVEPSSIEANSVGAKWLSSGYWITTIKSLSRR